MATYILAGGLDEDHPEYVKNLARVVEMKVKQPRILGVWFSVNEEKSGLKFQKFHDYLLPYFSQGATYERAVQDQFISQIHISDVIYFHGGSTKVLIQTMDRYPTIKKELEHKIVIGSSAGANYLSSYCWSPTEAKVVKGSGILDIALINHYASSGFADLSFEPDVWNTALDAVRAASGKNEVLLLPEGMFAMFEGIG